MSTKVMAMCWPIQTTATAKSVLISLADNANDEGYCYPSIPLIAERTCLNRRTVERAIKHLEEENLLVADRSNGRHTTYVVTPMGSDTESPVTESRHRHSDQNQRLSAAHQRLSAAKPATQRRSNHKEPSFNRQEPSIGELPPWLPAEVWADWCEFRKKKSGKGWTLKAQQLCLKDLGNLQADGFDPVAVVEQSIKNGWAGLFPIKSQRRQGKGDTSNSAARLKSLQETFGRPVVDESGVIENG